MSARELVMFRTHWLSASKGTTTFDWRKNNDIDSILTEAKPHFNLCSRAIPRYLHRRSRDGDVVCYEFPDRVDIDAAAGVENAPVSGPPNLQKGRPGATCSIEDCKRHYLFLPEFIGTVLERGNPERGVVCVVDMSGGLGLVRSFFSKLRSLYTETFRTLSDHYPPVKRLFVVNSPALFHTVWAVIAPLLDPEIVARTTICGTDFLPKLQEVVEHQHIPAELGGGDAHCALGHAPEHLALRRYAAALNEHHKCVPAPLGSSSKVEHAASEGTTAGGEAPLRLAGGHRAAGSRTWETTTTGGGGGGGGDGEDEDDGRGEEGGGERDAFDSDGQSEDYDDDSDHGEAATTRSPFFARLVSRRLFSNAESPQQDGKRRASGRGSRRYRDKESDGKESHRSLEEHSAMLLPESSSSSSSSMRRNNSNTKIGGSSNTGGDGRPTPGRQHSSEQDGGILRGLGLGLGGEGADEFGQYNYDDGDDEVEETTRGCTCGGFPIDFRPWWCGVCLKLRNCLVSCGAHTSCYVVMLLCHAWNLLPSLAGDHGLGTSAHSSSTRGRRRNVDGKAYEMVRVAD